MSTERFNRHLGAAVGVGLALLSFGCLTAGVVYQAKGGTPRTARIEEVTAAAIRDDQVYLKLDLRRLDEKKAEAVVLRIPISEIGSPAHPRGPELQGDQMRLSPALFGYFEKTREFPPDAVPLTVDTIRFGNLNDPGWLQDLGGGVHVIRVRPRDVETLVRGPAAGTDPSSFLMSQVYVVMSDAEGQRETELGYFEERGRKQPAWYLLTPLSAVGDLVTLPVQIIAILVKGDCDRTMDGSGPAP